jgi:hypothetical protein
LSSNLPLTLEKGWVLSTSFPLYLLNNAHWNTNYSWSGLIPTSLDALWS